MTATKDSAAPPVLRPARDSDIEALSDLLADAFWDDPIQGWLFPDDRRRRARLGGFYRRDLRHRLIPLGHSDTDEDLTGAALWSPPNRCWPPLGIQVRLAPAYLSLIGLRGLNAARGLRMIEAAHPAEPHWHLSHLGVHPDHQGCGVGGALLAAGLDRCDHDGLPAYLESSKESNLAYYSRFGFETIERLELPGGPPVWLMWREAGSPSGTRIRP